MFYPLTFQPILKERVWGGRNLERLYQKPLPSGQRIGESWEISDRPEGISVVANGPLAGRTLRWLMENHRRDVLGQNASPSGPFPLLIKILDATETLSVQVHPPPKVAALLQGEPKTELWYLAEASPEAALFVGLRAGVTRGAFEESIAAGTVAECLHRVPVQTGDVMFLPSGRLHAIGAGSVIFEVQQNSDTTYRVFDWNRTGLDGKPRPLHIAESLQCIDFEDIEPGVIASKYSRNETFKVRYLVDNALFRIDACLVNRNKHFHLRSESAQILGVLQGRLRLTHPDGELVLSAGGFCLLPACLERVSVDTERRAEFLHIQPA